MEAGWLIGVLVEESPGAEPVRHFFAVGEPERARAEWKAVDGSHGLGPVATSPHGGIEPVGAIRSLTAARMRSLGLAPGEVRALGPRWPRRWASG